MVACSYTTQGVFAIVIHLCQFDHRIFQVDHRHKMDLRIKGKAFFSVIFHIKLDAFDCNDTGSLEACICKNIANLPVFADFILLFSPLSKQNK